MTRSNSKPPASIRLGRSALAIGAGVVAGLLALLPLPYFIIAPGRAIDLSTRVTVDGRPAAGSRYFLTDVTVARATLLESLARFLPATDLVPTAAIMPGDQTPQAFDRSMSDAMTESQNVASYVAERAAGLPVRDDFILRVVGFPPHAPAAGVLRVGDRVLAVAGVPVHGTSDIARTLAASITHARIGVTIERDGTRRVVSVPEMRVAGGARRLGIYVSARLPAGDLPLPVRFSMDDVSGASGGLMFALQIYADVRGSTDARTIAGTGTIAPDGSVGPIAGTRQKFEAARRAGAVVFFVPVANATDLAHESRGAIAVVPVRTFDAALRYLARSRVRAN